MTRRAAGVEARSGKAAGETILIPQATISFYGISDSVLAAAQEALADRRMRRAEASVHHGGILAAVARYGSAPSPNLLFVESDADHIELLLQLDALADVCAAKTKLVVVGHINDVGLYRELIDRGVSEYVVAPLEPMALIEMAARLLKNQSGERFGRSVAFIGASGGAGSSTVAQNVAAALADDQQAHVILADLDLAFGSADLTFNLRDVADIGKAMEGAERLDAVLLERLLTKSAPHLSVLPAPSGLAEPYDLAPNALERFLEVAQAIAPVTALDVPHEWTPWVEKALMQADEIVITAVPTLAALRNASHLIAHLRTARPNDPPPKLVLNQVGMHRRAEVNAGKFSAVLGVDPIACLRHDAALFSAAENEGRTIFASAPRSPAAKAFATIARNLAGVEAPPKTASPWSRLLGRRK